MIVEYIRYSLNSSPPSSSSDQIASAFEAAYGNAAAYLDASSHCLGYELTRCIEERDRYMLRIEWDSIDGHMGGFRKSPEFASFFAAIKPYLGNIEEMQHYGMTAVHASKTSGAVA